MRHRIRCLRHLAGLPRLPEGARRPVPLVCTSQPNPLTRWLIKEQIRVSADGRLQVGERQPDTRLTGDPDACEIYRADLGDR